jgi:hypothetical protein
MVIMLALLLARDALLNETLYDLRWLDALVACDCIKIGTYW